ncbi:MAG: putative NAD(P)H nitroreductase YfhC [Planctomycetota bacterium]|nr:MAG: putative NAD(P)H nitroreductase YfhC [Planctomycetota bacterium]
MRPPSDIHRVIMSRRTIHRFRPEPVPEHSIERALQAAVRAPNHKLTNPWRFLRLGAHSRERLAEIARRLQEQKLGAPLDPEQAARLRAKLLGPPALLVCAQVRDPDPLRAEEDYAACACACYAFMLALWAEGIGSRWSTGALSRAPQTLELLGLEPERERIVALIWIGYPEAVPQTPRRPLAELVRRLP